MQILAEADANRVYDILIRYAGARDCADLRAQFVHYAGLPLDRKEFRFGGLLGFGGKVRMRPDRPYPFVDCYTTDLNEQREAAIEATNLALREIRIA